MENPFKPNKKAKSATKRVIAKAIGKSVKNSFKAGKAKNGYAASIGGNSIITAGAGGGAIQKAAGAVGAKVNKVKAGAKTFKKEFKAQKSSDLKANTIELGGRKSAFGAAASKLRQGSAAGKAGNIAGKAYKLTAARKAALMKAVRASAAKRRK